MRYPDILRKCALLMLPALLQLPAGAAFGGVESHCAADETVIFSCPTAGRKLISVCASKQYGPDSGYLQYRYGPAKSPEIALPAARTAPGKAAKSGLWSFSGGGGAYMEFTSGKTAYYVYTAIGNWGKKDAKMEKAGVAARKDGKVIADIRCKGKETSDIGPEFFEKAGLPEVENEFDLP